MEMAHFQVAAFLSAFGVHHLEKRNAICDCRSLGFVLSDFVACSLQLEKNFMIASSSCIRAAWLVVLSAALSSFAMSADTTRIESDSVLVSWDPNGEPLTYNVYFDGVVDDGVVDRTYRKILGTSLLAVDFAPGTWQVTVTAVDTAGNESERSEPVWFERVASASEPDTVYRHDVTWPLRFLWQHDGLDTLGQPVAVSPEIEFGNDSDWFTAAVIVKNDTLVIAAGVFLPGQNYFFRARAVNRDETSKASDWLYTEPVEFVSGGVPRLPLIFKIIR